MPPANAVYIPDDKTLNEAADKERQERAKVIDTALAYYDGDHKKPLKAEKDGTNASVILNLTAQTINDNVQFLGVPALEIPGAVQREPGKDGKLVVTKDANQDALDAFWERLDLAEFVAECALFGFLTGHVFVRLYEADDSEELIAERVDTRLVTVFWDAGRRSRPLWYRVSWQIDDKTQRRQDLVPNRLMGVEGDGWQIIEYELKATNRWEVIGQDAWDFPFAPIVEWPNKTATKGYYGASDFNKQLNDAINFTASNTAKIIKHHGGPQTILTGGHLPDDVVSGPGIVLEVENPEAKMYNLEMESDLSSSLNFLNKLEARFFSEAHVVDLATIQDKLGQITNFGVRMMFIKMIDNLTMRRRAYGKGLREVSRRALVMLGQDVEKVEDIWPDMLPVNRVELVNTLTGEKALGVLSVQTASGDLGRDFDREQEQIEEEHGTETDREVDRQTKLGNEGLFR